MAGLTTVALRSDTKAAIDARKVHPREPYDEVLRRILGLERREAAQEGRTG